MEEIIKRLKEQIANSDELGYDRDQASWGYEQGVLLTVEEAEKIVSQLIEEKKRWELILALASNPAMTVSAPEITAKYLIEQADAIIKQLEAEK